MNKKKASTGTKRTASKTASTAGKIHPVFGPVADPGPDGFGGGGGWGPWGGWHGGPLPDPAPFIRGSLTGFIDRGVLEASTVRQLNAIRVRRLEASVASLEKQMEIDKAEFEILKANQDKLYIDKNRLPRLPDSGDPAPELRLIDSIRYLHDLRTSAMQRSVAYLRDSIKAIETAP